MQLINSKFLKYFHTFYHISLTSSTATIICFIVIPLFIVYYLVGQRMNDSMRSLSNLFF